MPKSVLPNDSQPLTVKRKKELRNLVNAVHRLQRNPSFQRMMNERLAYYSK